MDKVAASLGLHINASKTEILSIDKNWEEGHGPGQQGPGVVISEGVVKEVSQFQYLGSVLVTDGRLDVELNIRKGKAVGRFKQSEKMWGTKHLIIECVELAIRRGTRHHVYNAHHVSSTAEEKAPPGHYKEHTSRSIQDIRGLASHRNQDAQPLVIIDRRVAGPTSPPVGPAHICTYL
jgi:hypothetical protein